VVQELKRTINKKQQNKPEFRGIRIDWL